MILEQQPKIKWNLQFTIPIENHKISAVTVAEQ